jgi:hypothetical protein
VKTFCLLAFLVNYLKEGKKKSFVARESKGKISAYSVFASLTFFRKPSGEKQTESLKLSATCRFELKLKNEVKLPFVACLRGETELKVHQSFSNSGKISVETAAVSCFVRFD